MSARTWRAFDSTRAARTSLLTSSSPPPSPWAAPSSSSSGSSSASTSFSIRFRSASSSPWRRRARATRSRTPAPGGAASRSSSGPVQVACTGRSPVASARRWQREMIVGSSACGESVTSRISVRGGGSSRVFRNALADSWFIRSAPSRTATFQPPQKDFDASCARLVRTCSTPMIRLFFSGSSQTTSGCVRPATRSHSAHFPHGGAKSRQSTSCAMPRARARPSPRGLPTSR